MIKRVLLLGSVGIVGWRLLRRRGAHAERATIGYADGTSVVLEPGAPELERMLAIAREVIPS